MLNPYAAAVCPPGYADLIKVGLQTATGCARPAAMTLQLLAAALPAGRTIETTSTNC